MPKPTNILEHLIMMTKPLTTILILKPLKAILNPKNVKICFQNENLKMTSKQLENDITTNRK